MPRIGNYLQHDMDMLDFSQQGKEKPGRDMSYINTNTEHVLFTHLILAKGLVHSTINKLMFKFAWAF